MNNKDIKIKSLQYIDPRNNWPNKWRNPSKIDFTRETWNFDTSNPKTERCIFIWKVNEKNEIVAFNAWLFNIINFAKIAMDTITSPYLVNLMIHEIWNVIIVNSSCMTINVILKVFYMLETYISSDIIVRGVNTFCTLFFLPDFVLSNFPDKIFLMG